MHPQTAVLLQLGAWEPQNLREQKLGTGLHGGAGRISTSPTALLQDKDGLPGV